MLLFSLAFLCGDVLFQQFLQLPNLFWVCCIAMPIVPLYKMKKYNYIAFFCGFLWAFTYAYLHLAWVLPKNIEDKNIVVDGYIASIPDSADKQSQFLFKLKKINHHTAHGLIQLSWRNTDHHLMVGDSWKLSVKLKRIHGMMNPGGSDYEAWAFQEGIIAHGYVINHQENKLLNHSIFNSPINRIRQYLKENIEQHIPKTNTSPWIIALALGERHGIPQDNWEVLRNTGTNHLMAIAGLHIGFMSGFLFAIVSFLWRRSLWLSLKMPAQHAGAIAALIMTLIYSAMAGFSIPTQRACIMLVVFLVFLLLRRKIISWSAWSLALLIVLILNPATVLSESFWLSFGSVALIIYGVSGRINPKGIWWKYGRIQWVIALGLLPMSIWLFQQFSLVAFIANSIAIPWVGFVIVPLILSGCLLLLFSAKLGTYLLIFADKNLTILWAILSYFSHFSWAVWYQYLPNHWMIITAMIGIVILLIPRGFPGRWLGIIWLLPLLLYKPLPLKSGEVKFTLLDVGQGLSAVVQTQHHLLVFDTGARLNDNFDMGNRVVIPFLKTLSNKKIDMLVISHGDNDHSGGSKTILQKFPVDEIRTSVPENFTFANTNYCLQNQAWQWDGVNFQFLSPAINNLHLDNDSSCVLKVSTKNKSILLTGDIEKFAENFLVANDSQQLKSTILIAPHHGSKTSSEDNFLNAVHPDYVLFPIGYKNRYHFPHPVVLEKYNKLLTQQFNTATAGAIQFNLSNDYDMVSLDLYRMSHLHYWNIKEG